MLKANPHISSWSLFGESSELPDVLHCETIAARSVQYDWELAPHRHARLHQVLLVQRGRGEAQLEGQLRALPPMSLVNVPSSVVHAFRFERGTQGWVTTLPDVMLDALAPGHGGEVRGALAQAAVVPAPAPLAGLVAQLMSEFEGRAPARALVLRGLGATLVGYTARLLAEHADAAVDRAAPPPLLARFQALLDEQLTARWSVADYARALAVTPGHLSRLTRDATGQPASKLIDEHLVREARRQLAYTQAPVGAVAEALGFADTAHFSRVFARATGMSPRAFRQGLGAQGGR
ncbi:helix-turn-helix domain-containing protein [Roseateles paludis]|uniref:Helix-turn-helix domain-containing protein n=1 Tax=Roseateles paludis TaxID=3145238 RepID=A0ABV0FZM2_9BURK